MPENITDLLVFTDPIAVPVDADTRNAASAKTPWQALSDRTRNLANRTGGLLGAGEAAYLNAAGVATPRARVIIVPAFAGFGAFGQWSGSIFGVAPTQGWRIKSEANTAQWFFPLSRYVPKGGVVNEIAVMIAPGLARAVQTTVPGDNGRMTLHYFDQTLVWGVSEVYAGPLAAIEDDGTVNLQALTLPGGPLGLTIDPTTTTNRVVVVTAGNTGGVNKDDVIAMRLTLTDPGPINA